MKRFNLVRDHVGIVLTAMRNIIVCVMVLCSCSNFIPLQDCGDIPNISVEGIVIDIDGQPINNAEIQIHSMNENLCPNASDFDSITIQSQADGGFSYTIPYMSEGEIITFNVSHEGYGNFSTRGTYTLFDEEIEIMLFPNK